MTHSDDREAWLAARRNYLCGSDVAAVLGEASYRTREQVLAEKAGLVAPWEGHEGTDIGLDLEPAIAAMAARKWGWSMRRCGELIVDKQCQYLAATPDYFVETPWGRVVAQIKSTICSAQEDCKPRKNGAESTARFAAGAPIDYQLQVSAELAVTGLEWGAVLVLHCAAPHMKLRSYPVRRHEGVIARIRREAEIFMAEVAEARRKAT